MSLDAEDLEAVILAIEPNVPKACAAVKLYVANDDTWIDPSLYGALTFYEVENEDDGTSFYYLKLVDLEKRAAVWEQEIYFQFQYYSPTQFFHAVETDDYVVGLSFANQDESISFYQTVMICVRDLGREPGKGNDKGLQKNKSVAGAAGDKARKAAAQVRKTVQIRPFKNIGTGSVKKMMKWKQSKPKEATSPLVISAPDNFRHTGHVGWSPGQALEVRDVPPEWQEIFQQVGLSAKQLRNPETAQVVMNIMTKATLPKEEPTVESVSIPSAPAPPAPPVPPAPPAPNSSIPSAPSVPSIQTEGPPAPPPPASDSITQSNSSGVSFLEAIQKGRDLKKVDTTAPRSFTNEEKNSLVDTLTRALANIRMDLEEDEEEDEWSDD